jgi:hypothetical protein
MNLRCDVCGHTWKRRSDLDRANRLPKVCPRCKSYKWHQARCTKCGEPIKGTEDSICGKCAEGGGNYGKVF